MNAILRLPSLLTGSALLLSLAGCRSAPPPAPRTLAELASQTMIQPPRLEPGDTIMFVAPAGDLDEERMLRAKERLETLGYEVKMRRDLFAADGYLAGPDKRRAKELMQAFLDPEVDAIFPGTGGYGTMRIFDRLDFEEIRAHPKIVIGFSDITALHLVKVDGRWMAPTHEVPTRDPLEERIVGRLLSVTPAGDHLLVLKTPPGEAQGVALAIDRLDPVEVVGTLAGDDAIFVAVVDADAGDKAATWLKSLIPRVGD